MWTFSASLTNLFHMPGIETPEVRQTLRRLLRSPGLVAVVVVSLTIGITSVATLLGVLDGLFLRVPAGIRHAQGVVAVGNWAPRQPLSTYPDFLAYRERSRAFESLAAFAIRPYSVRVGGGEVVAARSLLTTASLPTVLGSGPTVGRWFTHGEDSPGAAGVALVRRSFLGRTGARSAGTGSAHSALGTILHIGDHAYTVIGVLPDDYTAPDLSPVDIVLPVANAPWLGGPQALSSRNYLWLNLIGRLRPGVTAARASIDVTAIYRRENVGARGQDEAELSRTVVPVQSFLEARHAPGTPGTSVSIWLTLLAVALLLVACANVAGLFLARGIRSRHDAALRSALGASRMRLVASVALEVGLLTAVAGGAALILAHWAGALLSRALFTGSLAAPPLDARTLVILATTTLLTWILSAGVAVIPVLHTDIHSELAGGPATAPHEHRRTLRTTVAIQSALAIVLVAEATLFTLSLRNALRVNLGIDLRNLVLVEANLRVAGLGGSQAALAVHRLVERVAAVPGVIGVGMTDNAALPRFLTYSVVPGDGGSTPHSLIIPFNAVTPGYLQALGVRLLVGRRFDAADVEANHEVALVSEALAKRLWPTGTAMGHCVHIGDASAPCARVVGVVSNRRASPYARVGASDVYVPLGSTIVPPTIAAISPGRQLAVRVAGNPGRVEAAVRAAVTEAVPQLTLVQVRTGDQYVGPEFRAWRLGATMVGIFAVLALALAAVGVLAVASHDVAQRKYELAIRRALGAAATDITRLILTESLVTALVGLLMGTGLAIVAAHFTRSLAFGTTAADPRLYMVAAVLLFAATTVASVPPLVRAATVDPATVLRDG